MKERSIIKLMLIGIVAFSACYYDSAENLYPSTECVTTNMSYQTNVAPILQHNCYVCHSAAVNNGNVTLDSYDEVIKHVNSGKLLGSIKQDPSFIPMPQNALKLASCDISKIEHWITDGAANN